MYLFITKRICVRSLALAALGQGRDLAMEKVATRELAYELFTSSFMDELIFVSAI